jgi:hypothetical protein
MVHCKYDIVFVQFLTMFPIRFFTIKHLIEVNISKLYHMLGSHHSTFYV